MKLKTRIILGFTMIILMPLLLFAATLYGFSQSQAQKAQAVTESDGTVYDISITDSADSQGRVHVMAKDEAGHGKGFEGLYKRYFGK